MIDSNKFMEEYIGVIIKNALTKKPSVKWTAFLFFLDKNLFKFNKNFFI